jgi:HD-GYP domain-containing protein (c-di-GMP phosphodiesterase class II)
VGKVCIADRILNKPGKLEPAERDEVKRHTVVGAEMLARIDGLDEVVPWVRHSHEHIDGSGYPDGLIGDAIPMASRILLTADAFDTMTSERPYGRALSVTAALAELERHAGTQFDVACVAELSAALDSRRAATARPVAASSLDHESKAPAYPQLEPARATG